MTVRSMYPNYQAEFRGRSKYFAASKFGGPERAYRAARRWEKQARASAPPPERRLQSNNSSGVEGLRAEYREYSAGNQYLYVCAYWVKNGRPSSSSASAHKHGLMTAVKMAMSKREAGSGKAIGLTPAEVVERLHIEVRG